MELLGYFLAALVGLSLGLIGGGGSILTVPILVYIMGIEPVLATSYSLFIVGSTSLIGAISNYRKGFVSLKTAMLFGLSSVTTVYLVRKLIMPRIPTILYRSDDFTLLQSTATMLLFALLMILAAIAMIRNKRKEISISSAKTVPAGQYAGLILYGMGIGLVTGFLGAGGGFLLIPALVLIVKLPMKTAVGTSLLIIAINSLIGFTGDISRFPNRDGYAAYNGTAPVERSSGGRVVHRVSQRGNRRLNHALHLAAICQIRQPSSEGRVYFERKLAEGKTKKDAVRSLKRHISNAVYRQLLIDAGAKK